MTSLITAAELPEILKHMPPDAILLVETESGCFAKIDRPEVPHDTVPSFSQQQADPAPCNDAAPEDSNSTPRAALYLVTGRHWRLAEYNPTHAPLTAQAPGNTIQSSR